jgi:DNA polymerase-3 subunit epsilon
MQFLHKTEFICLDVEATGLSKETDRVIEVAAALFLQGKILEEMDTLINPARLIPPESQAIHNINDSMVEGKPLIQEILPSLHAFIGNRIIIGHGIQFDIDMLNKEAERSALTIRFGEYGTIDTLRLARLYGESPSNSLEVLRQHFNIEAEGAHRALSDVRVNYQIFHRLTTDFRSVEQINQTLSKPILMKNMPLGKHKGRPMKEIPLEYLKWASYQEFDQDLLYSLRTELSHRKTGDRFSQSSNPFLSL